MRRNASRYQPVRSVRRDAAGRRAEEKKPSGGAGVVLVQAFLCLLAVAVVFALRALDPGRYEAVGVYYRALTGGAGEAAEVGSFGEPITLEEIRSFFEKLSAQGLEPTELSASAAAGGQGGEEAAVPDNVYLGRLVFSTQALDPVKGYVSCGFGARTHPITGKPDFHTGVDIAAAYGSDIYAVFPGRVAEVGESAAYGKYIRLEHSAGLATVYCHCSEILAEEGAVLRAGERIALVGSTGVSTGPHLHLTLLVNGNYADPMQLYVR